MYHLPDFLYEINLLSVSLRLILALLFGGIIGLERGSNRHPAGFRTHILVCVGAALAMMTNQFILQQFDTGDPARLGAQVITGVGFLGVGTILVTGRHKIKGLTTAAGLWASACLGLAIGIGFYSETLASPAIAAGEVFRINLSETVPQRAAHGKLFLPEIPCTGSICRGKQSGRLSRSDPIHKVHRIHLHGISYHPDLTGDKRFHRHQSFRGAS